MEGRGVRPGVILGVSVGSGRRVSGGDLCWSGVWLAGRCVPMCCGLAARWACRDSRAHHDLAWDSGPSWFRSGRSLPYLIWTI